MEHNKMKYILIGGSAGSGTLIKKIISQIPEKFTIPIIIVRHIAHDGLENTYMEILSESCSLAIREPEDKETIKNGTVYLAPSGYHLLIEKKGTFALSLDARVHYSRPSIDILFESAARAFGPEITGILLSGANCDGAKGLKMINESGGLTVVQDPETADFPRMPESAMEESEVNYKFTVDQIINLLSIRL